MSGLKSRKRFPGLQEICRLTASKTRSGDLVISWLGRGVTRMFVTIGFNAPQFRINGVRYAATKRI